MRLQLQALIEFHIVYLAQFGCVLVFDISKCVYYIKQIGGVNYVRAISEKPTVQLTERR